MAFRRVSDGNHIPPSNLGYNPQQYGITRPPELPPMVPQQASISPVPQQSHNPFPPQHVPFNGSNVNQSHSPHSSYSVLSYQTGQSSNQPFMNVFHNGSGVNVGQPGVNFGPPGVNVGPPGVNVGPPGNGISLTDISLEKAMEKVHELAMENNSLRDHLKENNENMRKQFENLLAWKDKIRNSNKANLLKFDQLRSQLNILKQENEKYKQCLTDPQQKGTVMEDLQKHIRILEQEKIHTQHELSSLRERINDMKSELEKRKGVEHSVLVNSSVGECEADTLKRRCMELSQQVANFHHQNDQLMIDMQELNNSKVQIQEENKQLYECNLELQKRLQAFLGDMNKTKYSIGALQDPTNRDQYGQGSTSGNVETERYSSSTAKTDIEILERQISQGDMLRSGEIQVSAVEEELKEKLQIEKEKTTKQSVQLNGQEAKISRLQSQLSEKDQMLGHYKEQLDSQITHITQEHAKQQENLLKQLDNLTKELNQKKSSMAGTEDVHNLRSQVMSLINESQELSTKLDMATKTIDKKSSRIMELEDVVRAHEQSRQEINNYIQTMKSNMTISEGTINKERADHAVTKKQLHEYRESFNRIVADYKELLDTFDKFKAQQTGGQRDEEINRLTAQTIAAEEAITYRDEQIKQLKAEIIGLKDDVDNTIPVLRAQADLWKQDFDAERAARERQVEEKNTLLQEMKNLEMKNQQLIDELENYSRRSLAEMQRRHASPTYQQQLQGQLQGGVGAGYQPAQYPNQAGTQHRQGGQPGYPPGNYQTGQQAEHTGNNEEAMTPANPPQQSQAGGGVNEDMEEQNKCPKCGIVCPDIDTLQIHVLDCLDN